MLLRNLYSVSNSEIIDIKVSGDKILSVYDQGEYKSNFSEEEIIFKDAIVFPGLINSHDHLDFNSFPQLGHKIYNNYVEWGDDIHDKDKEIIAGVLKIPKSLRVQWGVYKNLLNGITTVVNHGASITMMDELITVFQKSHVLHSVQLEKGWKYKLNKPSFRKWPYVIHIGEGTDAKSNYEIDELIKWNLFKKDIIGIHGVAMSEQQAAAFKALIWCPVSNYFLVGKTASIDQLKYKTIILFGTDSTVSAGWNIWEHLRVAQQQNMVSEKELFEMLTSAASTIWQLPGSGNIASGHIADIVIAKRKNNAEGLNAFFAVSPEDILLVMHKGIIRMIDTQLYKQVERNNTLRNYNEIYMKDSCKYVQGDLPSLMKQITKFYPDVNFPISYR